MPLDFCTRPALITIVAPLAAVVTGVQPFGFSVLEVIPLVALLGYQSESKSDRSV
jgi:hypothetical protein